MESFEGTSSTQKLKFFKFMFGDFQERLRIPDKFLKHLPGDSYHMATIKDPSGHCWHVKVDVYTDGLYFEDGWEKFSNDHSLTLGELLVFNYNGDMEFTVNIFAKSGCKRDGTCEVYCSQDPPRGQRQNKRAGAKEKADSFTSQFPFFVCELKDHHFRKNQRVHPNIPAQFAKSHLPDVPTYITLQNPEGHMWRVKAYICQQHHCFTAGWKTFSRENTLRKGDYCVFEIVGELKLQVHIFRDADLK